jgi:hypothetical protein
LPSILNAGSGWELRSNRGAVRMRGMMESEMMLAALKRKICGDEEKTVGGA